MVRRDPLPKDILDKLPAACRAMEAAPEVVFAYLFGGLARGAPRPLSDVDIAVFLRDAERAARDEKSGPRFSFKGWANRTLTNRPWTG